MLFRTYDSLVEKLRNFQQEGLKVATQKKVQRSEKKRPWVLCFFSGRPPPAADALTSLRTIEKKMLELRKNLDGHEP